MVRSVRFKTPDALGSVMVEPATAAKHRKHSKPPKWPNVL